MVTLRPSMKPISDLLDRNEMELGRLLPITKLTRHRSHFEKRSALQLNAPSELEQLRNAAQCGAKTRAGTPCPHRQWPGGSP